MNWISLSCKCKKQVLLLFAFFSFTFLFAQNAIVTENALTGNPASEWDISGIGSSTLQGFATDISVNKGSRVNFKINTSTVFTYTIKVYRLGYYQGNGARLITTLPTVTGTVQPAPVSNATTGIVDCGNWSISSFWDVPSTAVSGVYIAKLTSTANSAITSHIIFIVRDDASTSDLFFQTSDATWQAYNNYGGNSLYLGTTGFPGGHAVKVSYNRPFNSRAGGGGGGAMEDWIFNAEFPMIRFLERNGYNVSYTTNVDAVRRGNLILNHKVFLSVGHDEYWSAEQRASVETARNAGVHLAFFSGNEVYWKTRWENSVDGSNTAYRTLVCYKEGTLGENICGYKCDPTNLWTGLWRDGASWDGGKPENALSGNISWGGSTAAIEVPSDYKNLWFWRNTSIASLANGTKATLTAGTLGFEWDFEQYASSYPAGRVTLSSTTVGDKTHKLSLYRHSSGALVFGAGTIQWSWGLDNVHDRGNAAPSVAMQQATVNLFADMGVQPATIQAGLTLATASADLTAPVVNITSPANGATLANNTAVTISGTASDAGGVVTSVQISVDGGTVWQTVTGTTNWTYSWTPTVSGPATIKVRGIDNSGNIGVPGAAGSPSNISVTISGSSTCPCNIFPSTSVPSSPLGNDGQALEIGVKFRVTQAGYITGIRYYKGAGSSGTRIGHLWSSTGTMLAEATFTGETASGWQQVLFTTPVAVATGTTYVASYFSSAGYYALTNPYFTSAVVNGPLRALANGEDGGNGVYKYSATSAFPVNNFQSSNYWVDVVFSTTAGADVTPPTVTSVLPLNGATGVAINTTVSAVFNEDMNAATISSSTIELRNPSNVLVTATVTYNAGTRTATLTPSAALVNSTVYTAKVKSGASGVKDVAGNALVSDYNWSFTTVAADVTPPTVTSVSPLNGATGVSVSTTVIANFSEAVNASTVTASTFQLKDAGNNIIAASVSAASGQITLTPSSSLAFGTVYTATITGGSSGVKDLAGNALASNYSWSFTTASSAPVTYNIFPSTSVPSSPAGNDGQALELGVKFRVTQAGYITGIRYYKGAGSSGTRIGHLWSSTGTKLAEATFTGETASGWQQVLFTTPVAVATGTTYVASYFSSAGYYALTNPYFTSAVVNGPLRALANGEDGGNGVYIYAAASAFPNNNFQSSNYWVDVVFSTTDITPPTVTSVLPLNGATGVAVNTTVSAVFNEDMTAATISSSTIELRNPSNVLITATVTYNGGTRTATLTPSAVLTNSTVYTAKVKSGMSGVKDVAGNALASDFTWSFTTAAADVTPPTVTSVSPVNGATGVSVSTTVIANFSEAVNASTVTTSTFQLKDAGNNIVAASVSTASGQITLTPSSSLAFGTVYTATITGGSSGVKDLAGNALASNYSWSFTTASAAPVTYNIFSSASAPASFAGTSTQPLEIGVKFRVTQAGYITGIRYYKGAGSTGTRIGHLWSSTGTKLAEATFTGETASGWQQVLFTTPVAVATGITYVASYFSSAGSYGITNPYFTSAVVNGPLRALANGEDGGNGVYVYTAASAFPNNNFQSSNYWVDVVFTTGISARMMTTQSSRQQTDEEASGQKLVVKITPNPSAGLFKLIAVSDDKNPVSVRVVDISGRVLERYEKVTPNSVLQISQTLKSGIYFAEVIQGDQRKVVKIIKVN